MPEAVPTKSAHFEHLGASASTHVRCQTGSKPPVTAIETGVELEDGPDTGLLRSRGRRVTRRGRGRCRWSNRARRRGSGSRRGGVGRGAGCRSRRGCVRGWPCGALRRRRRRWRRWRRRLALLLVNAMPEPSRTSRSAEIVTVRDGPRRGSRRETDSGDHCRDTGQLEAFGDFHARFAQRTDIQLQFWSTPVASCGCTQPTPSTPAIVATATCIASFMSSLHYPKVLPDNSQIASNAHRRPLLRAVTTGLQERRSCSVRLATGRRAQKLRAVGDRVAHVDAPMHWPEHSVIGSGPAVRQRSPAQSLGEEQRSSATLLGVTA